MYLKNHLIHQFHLCLKYLKSLMFHLYLMNHLFLRMLQMYLMYLGVLMFH